LITNNVTGSRFQNVFTVSGNGFLGTADRVVSVDRRNLFTEPRATDVWIAQYFSAPFPASGLFRRNTASFKVFYKEVSGVSAMVANSVIEFRADPDAKFTRLYLLLLNAAFENRQFCESHDDLISYDESVGMLFSVIERPDGQAAV
jgi:hypothetical protein